MVVDPLAVSNVSVEVFYVSDAEPSQNVSYMKPEYLELNTVNLEFVRLVVTLFYNI